jgi:hypothetical protein
MKGCLRLFQPSMKARILIIRSRTEGKTPRRMAWRSMMPNQTSTRFNQEAEVGVKVRSPAFLEALDLGLIGPREELIVTRPSRFAPEFKARAIDLYRSSEGRTIADVARELGIGTETFRKWVRQDEADRGERDDRLTSKTPKN